jgi:hypothetical protein
VRKPLDEGMRNRNLAVCRKLNGIRELFRFCFFWICIKARNGFVYKELDKIDEIVGGWYQVSTAIDDDG